MELTQHIENYKNTLNKTQQKQFDKILDVFEPLRPHTIHKVTKWIETEVLDGKQRLNAILDYIHGDFPIYGLYYNQLSDKNIQILYDVPMVFKHIVYYGPNGQAEMPLDIKLELFLQENQ